MLKRDKSIYILLTNRSLILPGIGDRSVKIRHHGLIASSSGSDIQAIALSWCSGSEKGRDLSPCTAELFQIRCPLRSKLLSAFGKWAVT